MSTQDIMSSYWGTIIIFVCGIIYVILHFNASKSIAKKKAIELIFLVEKKAEEFALTQGKEKLKWVVENGYNYLPSYVRIFISKPMFGLIVQEAFDTIIGLTEKHRIDKPAETQLTK